MTVATGSIWRSVRVVFCGARRWSVPENWPREALDAFRAVTERSIVPPSSSSIAVGSITPSREVPAPRKTDPPLPAALKVSPETSRSAPGARTRSPFAARSMRPPVFPEALIEPVTVSDPASTVAR